MTTARDYNSIDEYIGTFPENVQKKLKELRKTIREQAPDAEEKISYQMPTFYLNGNLVHFAAFAKHIGFFPTPAGIDAYEDELAKYRSGKGTLQFPLAEPLPLELIKKIVKTRVDENLKKKKKSL
jgi:uncharacterized protein YdhG (YjbR/CyaY superfamily)